MAKWGQGPRDLTVQTRVLILRRGVSRFTAFFLQVLVPSYPVAGRGLGPKGSTVTGWSPPGHRLRPQVIFLSEEISATLEPGAFLPTHGPQSLTMTQVSKGSAYDNEQHPPAK